MPGMLYYPNINPPRELIYEGILYWDTIATIVPADHQRLLGDQMRQVHEAGLYVPINANRVLSQSSLEDVLYDFVGLLRTIPASELLPERAESGRGGCRLNVVKFPAELILELVERGLARLDEDFTPGSFSQTLWVPPAVEVCLLSIVARRAAHFGAEVGCTSDHALRPHTDQYRAHLAGHAITVASDLDRHENIAPCWEVEIGRLLPIPAGEVVLADVLRFRERYDGERRRLMQAIDRLIHELRVQYDHPQDVLRVVEAELTSSIIDLRAAIRSTKVGWVKRSAAISIAVGSGYGAITLGSPFSWLLGIAGGLAINVATNKIRTGGGRSAFSYLHRVGREISALN